MNENTNEEFLISKLLNVSENTIESLVKLKEELSVSSKDHKSHEEKINEVINNQRNIENLLINFKEQKPFKILDRIEDKQDKNQNDLLNIKDKLFSNDIETNIIEIKKDTEYMKTKDDLMRKWIIILSSISTISIFLMSIYKVFFENILK